MFYRLSALLFALSFGIAAAEVTPPKGFRALFNGENLDGWYGWNPHQSAKLKDEKLEKNLAKQRAEFADHWTVENGELVNPGTGPYATTKEEFENFELRIEYKTVPKADSGIYLRGLPQVQIWDVNRPFKPSKAKNRPELGSGGLYNNDIDTLGRDPMEKADKPFGEWNSFVIRMLGDRVWVKLNNREVVRGARMANYFDRKAAIPKKGPIMLQTHGGEIRWRNIFIREISPESAKRALERNPVIPEPTYYNVPYGSHVKQVMHFWKAESDKPTPVLFYIHGGGWHAGNRLSGAISKMLPQLLDAGISVASIEYRFIAEATAEGIEPPVKAPVDDAGRALQFLRSKAEEWGIDKTKIAASGTSAGGASSLCLAYNKDLADPGSDDPIARESTSIAFAALGRPQTSLDPVQMKEWIPNSRYGGHAFGLAGKPFREFLAQRDKLLPWINEYSAYSLAHADGAPVYLYYTTVPAVGQKEEDPTHSANFGVKFVERCKEVGAVCEVFYPEKSGEKPARTLEGDIVELFKSIE